MQSFSKSLLESFFLKLKHVIVYLNMLLCFCDFLLYDYYITTSKIG